MVSKITGMFLELDVDDIINILQDYSTLEANINESIVLLNEEYNLDKEI